jgi:amino acid permease
MFKKQLPLFQSISTMVGTIIGAGILGIPFVFAQAGFWTGTVVLGIVAFAMISLKMMVGEMTLRTYGKHQLSGYVEKYLGKFWKDTTSFVLAIAIAGSLLAYFVGIGEVLAELFGGSQIMWAFGFYILASIFLYFGLKLIKNLEFILTLGIFLIVILIFFLSQQHLNFNNLLAFDLAKIFIPYGVILFACEGVMAIPEVRQILLRKEYLFKKAIFWGAIIPAIIYFIFALIVVGVTGLNTTQVATIGLGNVVGTVIFILGSIFAFFTMSTSFLTIGLALKDTFNYDFKIKHFISWLITILLPLVIYFIGFKSFIGILSFFGAVGFGINGIIYIFTYWQARRHGRRYPEYALSSWFTFPVSIFLSLIFLGGLVYTILDII